MSSPFLDAMNNKPKTSSPLDLKEEPKSVFEPSPLEASPVYAPQVVREVKPLPRMSLEEIEAVGSESGQKLRSLTAEVLKHQRASEGGQMSEMMNKVLKEAKGLDPNSIQQSKGITKWVKKIMGVKEDLFAEFDSANGRVEALLATMKKDLDREKDSMVYVERLEKAIAEHALSLDRDIQLLSTAYEKELAVFNNIPEDDVEAKRASRDTLDLLEIRIGDMKALRLLCVQLAPRASDMKKVSAVLIRSAKNMIEQVIPAYAVNFSMYIGQLRQQRALQSQQNMKDTFNQIIVMGSDLQKQNQIAAAQLANGQLVDIETLRKDQENLIATIEETQRINEEARAARVDYMRDIQELEQGVLDKLKSGLR